MYYVSINYDLLFFLTGSILQNAFSGCQKRWKAPGAQKAAERSFNKARILFVNVITLLHLLQSE